jgi:hypothetical protein
MRAFDDARVRRCARSTMRRRKGFQCLVSTGVYAGMTRTNGLSAAVTYVVVSTTIVHLVVTGLFVRLTVALPRCSWSRSSATSS